MKVTIDIKEDKQLELIERLRGKKTTKEFAAMCFEAGLQIATLQGKRPPGPLIKFDSSKPEFKSLDATDVAEALKTKDPKNEIVIEVGRLVRTYSNQLRDFARKNGNRLPKSLRINAQIAIEKIAFQITAEAIKASLATQAKTSAA